MDGRQCRSISAQGRRCAAVQAARFLRGRFLGGGRRGGRVGFPCRRFGHRGQRRGLPPRTSFAGTTPCRIRMPTSGTSISIRKSGHHARRNREHLLPVGFPLQMHEEHDHQHRLGAGDGHHEGPTDLGWTWLRQGHAELGEERHRGQHAERQKHGHVLARAPRDLRGRGHPRERSCMRRESDMAAWG